MCNFLLLLTLIFVLAKLFGLIAWQSSSDYMRRVDMTNTSYTGDAHAK